MSKEKSQFRGHKIRIKKKSSQYTQKDVNNHCLYERSTEKSQQKYT